MQIRLQLLHFVLHLVKLVRQFLLRQGEHFRFFFLHVVCDILDQLLEPVVLRCDQICFAIHEQFSR